MTSTTTSRPDDVGRTRLSPNGATAESLPLSPPKSRRSRAPQALLAALLMVGGGLGGLVLFRQYDQRTPAVIMVAPVAHGQQLTRDHLAITEVALDNNVATIASLDSAVGRLAAHDLAPGELVSPQDLAGRDQIVTSAESVIGLLLEPGQYPTRQLTAGDRVDVFAPGAESELQNQSASQSQSSGQSESPAPSSLASDLTVFDVVESSNDGRTLLVSLVVTPEQAAAIFDAAEQSDGVRLSLLGEAQDPTTEENE